MTGRRRHLAIRGGVLLVLLLSALPTLDRPANPQHFDTARALLAGSLWVDEPTNPHDMGLVDGRWYSPFPPLAALLAVPALFFGQRADLVFNTLVLLAALAAVLMAGRLGSRFGGPATGSWAAVALGLGSGLWMAVTLHDTYHSSHVLSVAAVTAALDLGLLRRRRPLAAGLLLGIGALARQAVLLGGPSLAALVAGRRAARRRWLAAVLLGIALPASLYLGVNRARFGSAFRTGYGGVQHLPAIAEDVAAHGVFSLHWLPRNLGVALVGRPRLVSAAPWIVPDPRGISLLLVSPWLLLGLLPLLKPDRPPARRTAACCWLAAALISVPHLLYVNTGYVQFGYRFALDELPFLLLAAICGVRRLDRRWAIAALLAAVVVNCWGLLSLLTWERWSPLL